MRVSVMLPAGGCKGTTKLGRSCRGRDVFENGYCKHHGGQGKSLQERRLPLIIDKALRSSDKLKKRLAKWARRNPELRRLIEAKARKGSKCDMAE